MHPQPALIAGPYGTVDTRLDDLREAITPLRDQLLNHSLYTNVNTLPRLRSFMRYHVFAVWDFMCLAKRLQRDLTSLGTLWLPPARPALARFINSIVLAEESDVDPEHRAASHFDLYVQGMQEVGASPAEVLRFLAMIEEGRDVGDSLALCAPPAAQTFVSHTLETVAEGTTVEVLASFLFGREDLIPDMFSRIQRQWIDSGQAARFSYYVARHIELDGGEHGPAGLAALAELAGDDEGAWHAARRAAASALAARLTLWDAVDRDLPNVEQVQPVRSARASKPAARVRTSRRAN
jgi:hypothetical protein